MKLLNSLTNLGLLPKTITCRSTEDTMLLLLLSDTAI